MKLFRNLLILIILIPALSGCMGGAGRKFNMDYAMKIEEGVTTKAEVLQNLGEPYSRSRGGQRESWMYMYVGSANALEVLGQVYLGKDAQNKSQSLNITFLGNVVESSSLSY